MVFFGFSKNKKPLAKAKGLELNCLTLPAQLKTAGFRQKGKKVKEKPVLSK